MINKRKQGWREESYPTRASPRMATEVKTVEVTENGWEAVLASSAVGEPLSLLLGSSAGWPGSQKQPGSVVP